MAKELPYFRFTVQDWQNGKIAIESFEMQGLFISVCGYYWINDCDLTLTILKKKFQNHSNLLDELIKLDIVKHENRHDKVEIVFLNEQYDLLSEKRKARQNAGSKGGNAKAKLKQKGSYKDKDNNKDNNKDKDKSKAVSTELIFPFYSIEFMEAWDILVQSKKWRKKEYSALQASLKKLSKYTEPVAIKMIEDCIAGEWMGLVEPKNSFQGSNGIKEMNAVEKTLAVNKEVSDHWDALIKKENESKQETNG